MNNLIQQAFISKILANNFSCIGAKASIKNASYRFIVLKEIATEYSTSQLYTSLKSFVQERMELDKKFASFIVCFENQTDLTPKHFEQLLWEQLYMLHQLDECVWDSKVSNDVENPHFSFSIAGEAIFIVGMCPNHPRKCREFNYPTMVFNSHHQFAYLKQIGLFEKLKRNIRIRELKYSGSINPNLVDFAEKSEALQYSGLKASEKWKCPFQFNSKEGR